MKDSQVTLMKKQREINVSETLIPFENRKKGIKGRSKDKANKTNIQK